MLKKILENKISIVDNVKDWQEAIKIAASPLVADGSIEERYIEAMIENIKKFGKYIVVAPKVAMPHSRPEDGVNKNCLALLKINEGVVFGEETNEEEKVYFIFILGAIDNGSHIETLMKLMDVIDDEEKIDAMTKVSSVKELMELI
ncbi:MAG: PTS sugar transporter subunit IIA [Fusobacterium sp.]|uniref:PTS sugar transporter subunit IIA n=1 Tax=Fusobacterium sp. TaxID=68766 RepID=UPI002A75350B|nr:PTS sugar transporter subunit IIA [Fusobacterium sp.]MDY2980955.1 PTS sugar transporter subunit IIA [Fusobacterium sp.]